MRYFVDSNSDSTSLEVVKIIKSRLDNTLGFLFDEEKPELVISVGGDGRLLRCIRKYFHRIESLSFVGISTGSLGFLCEFKHDEVEEFLSLVTSKTPKYLSNRIIEVEYDDKKEYYVNEFRLEKLTSTLNCEVYINNEKFEDLHGNGVNVSTSTGSTGYNKSLNGPVVHPYNQVLIFGEIAPINNRVYQSFNSFLVLRDVDEIKLNGDFSNVLIGGDTDVKVNNISGEIKIRLSEKAFNFAYFKSLRYYRNLKDSFIR